MGKQLSDFFDKIFRALLSAFRKRYSCQSTLLNMIEHFKKSLDNGECVSCLSMDPSKAFDCLPHCVTICKLHSYGVSREACTLIASYLCGCKQRIKLGNTRSGWTELLKGVPQWSILGPLIFNIFLNDIFYFVSKGDPYNYADDNCISVSHKDISVLSKPVNSLRVKPRLWLNGLLTIPWKQMRINSKELFWPGTVKIQMFMLHWGILTLLSYRK